MLIRAATDEDANGIWSVIKPTIRVGEIYAPPRDMTKGEALAYWMGLDRTTFVAVDDEQILGTYFTPIAMQRSIRVVSRIGLALGARPLYPQQRNISTEAL